jgi:hypothetical protein
VLKTSQQQMGGTTVKDFHTFDAHHHLVPLCRPLHPTPGDGLPPEIGQQTTNSPSRSHDKEIYGPFSESSFDITQPLLWNDVAGFML